jgi:hypothetical protein
VACVGMTEVSFARVSMGVQPEHSNVAGRGCRPADECERESRELKSGSESDSGSDSEPVNGELSSQPGGNVVCGSQVGRAQLKGPKRRLVKGLVRFNSHC